MALWLLLVLASLPIVFALAWAFARRPQPRPLHLSTCGKCGYAVRGISSLECPECGADLREVGIVPAGRTAWDRLDRIPGWTYAYGITLLIAYLLGFLVLVLG